MLEGVRIAGVRACVPRQRHSFVETPAPFTGAEARKLEASTGVHSRRILPRDWCVSDLCCHAATRLIATLDWDPATIDVLVFVSQDADYVVPATACLLQRRLGLGTHAAAFDLPLGCSGHVYGLWIAGRLLGGSDGRRALVLAGDASARYLRPDDRATLPLFGDAGSATALERDAEASAIPVVLGTDGSGGRHIFVKAGGKRDPLIPERDPWSAEEAERLFNDSRLSLNGAEVFAFSLRTVPGLVAETLALGGVSIDQIDQVVLHQANAFMLEHLRKRCRIPPEKFVSDLAEFGNTSSASIPLAIAHRLAEPLASARLRLLLAGFGVGWSWAAMIAEVGPIPAPAVDELPDDWPPLEV